MKRRQFIAAAGLAGFFPGTIFSQTRVARFADMHAHLGFKFDLSFRAQMEQGGMLLVAEKVTPDSLLLKPMGGRFQNVREARPGELRRNFEGGLARRKAKYAQEGIIEVATPEALDRALKDRTPGVIWAAEGADFLEGDIAYLERARAMGLVHVQLVHFYAQSLIGDLATEEPVRGGLTAHGKDLVRACNRLGMLVDVAHCTNQSAEQVLEISTRPIVYSHGWISPVATHPSQGGNLARAIHAPVAKKIAGKGGVIGIWPNWYSYANLALYADELVRLAESLGPRHVGIGTDMHGLVRTIMPTYVEFAAVEGELARRGMKTAEIEGILGGNYLRVLREALKV